MEDLKKKINFDPALLYYSTPKENGDEQSKPSVLNVETYNSSNRKHICLICGKRFFTSNSLQTHMANHSSEELVTAGKEKDENADLKNRFVSSKGERCKKNNCNFIALDPVDYSKHTSVCEGIHFTKENSSAFCELCDCYFSSKNYFQAHSLLQHPENDPNITLQDGDVRNTKVSDPVSLYALENSCDQGNSTKSNTSLSMYPDSIVTKKKSKITDGETSQHTYEGTLNQMINGNETDSTNFGSEKSIADENDEASNNEQKVDLRIQDEIKSENNLEENSRMIAVTDAVVNVQHSNNSSEIVIEKSIIDKNEIEEIKSNSTEIFSKPCSQSNPSSNVCVGSASENVEHQKQISSCPVDTSINFSPVTSQENLATNVDVGVEHVLETENDCCKSSSLEDLMKADDSSRIFYENDSQLIEDQSKKGDETLEEIKKDFDDHPLVKEIAVLDEVLHQSNHKSDDSVQKQEICEGPSIDRNQSDVSISADDEKEAGVLRVFETSKDVVKGSENSVSEIIKNQPSLTGENVEKISPLFDASVIQELKNSSKEPEQKNKDIEKVTVKRGDSCQNENVCSTSSTPSSEMAYDEANCKKNEDHSQAIKSKFIHSTPSSDVRLTFPNRKKSKNVVRDAKYKRVSISVDDLNVKQRSVRQRKKLILPDYEYGLDHKADFSDSSATENMPSLCEREPVKKRGRPRKKPTESPNYKVANAKKLKPYEVPNAIPSSSSKSLKNSEENDEQSEEFCLSTTINESESDTGFDPCPGEISFNDSKMKEEILHEEEDDQNDEIHSWLKKVDFSEQSAFDSWFDKPPKKKLGRPPKKKKLTETLENLKSLSRAVENSVKVADVCNENSNIIFKKKKGRPSLKLKKKMSLLAKKQKLLMHYNSKESYKTSVGGRPKKRGRPSKMKLERVTNMNEVQLSDAAPTAEVIPNTAKVQVEVDSKSEENDLSKNILKKRGRPRKSDIRCLKPSTFDLESEDVSDTSVLKSETKNKSMDDSICSTVSSSEVQSSLSNSDMEILKKDHTKLSSCSPPAKKRGRPSKHNVSNMLENKTLLPDTSSRPRNQSFDSKNLSPENWMMSRNNQESFADKSDKEWKPPKYSLLKSMKNRVFSQNHSVGEDKVIPDETIKIDEALYYADLKSKSKFSRVFKKPVMNITEESANEVIVCGRCEKKMTRRHYLKYHQIAHYYLCWLEGESQINLNDDTEISRIIQSYVSPEALKKKAIRLSCELCDKVMKSVVGYVSHVRFCQKKDEKELLEKCTLCTKLLKPSSIRHHYVKFHGVSKFTTTSDSKIIPVSCAETKTEVSGLLPSFKKNSLMGFERVPVLKVDILNDEHFWKSLKTSYDLYMCMGLSCRHMTMGKDDLKTHILSCGTNFCEFSCLSCPYKTKYESEIIYHTKKNCKETSDSEDNAEEKSQPTLDRRISTRVKKRKHIFDYDDCTESERKKSRKQKDDEFILSDIGSMENSGGSELSDSDDSTNGRRDRKEKKSRFSRKKNDNQFNRNSEEGGFRQAFLYHSSTRNFDPLNWTVDVRLKTSSSRPVHLHLRVDINEWETFPISDLPKYSPLQHKSPKVSFEGSKFAQFKLFDSDVVKGVPVCYTGGPVWAMAWAPLPALVTEQYLAVAGLQHMNHVIDLSSPVEFPSLVQIWKFSSLDNISNDIHAPTLAWAVAHNFGAVLSMEWCPSGGFDNSSTPYRLGILALATSSGCCVIYSMPRLDCGGETRSIVANPDPDLILKVRYDNVQCTRIVWKKNVQPNIIYGGFSDGSIALWNISSTSSILKKGKTLYPYRTFEAHSSPVTALDVHWLDNCRFIVTSSSDRIMKYWDLEDLSGPMYEHELSNSVLNAVWMHHWVVTASGMDFINSCEPLSAISHPRDLTEKRKTILCIKDTFWSVAYSDWNDSVAVASQGGCVSVFAAKHMSALSWKQPDFEKIVTQTSLMQLAEEDKDKSGSIEESTGLPPTNDEYDCSSIIENNGLKFFDRIKAKPSSENLNYSVDEPNVVSVNKVCWNQNYNSFNWIAIGYECGFVRVVRVERFDKCHLTKFYKMNENNTITLI